jgi:cysteinyl-tRNA synthetase
MDRHLQYFVPRNVKKVNVFTCGPSTYRRPHIGNYRTFMYEDILVRYLEYQGYTVDRIIVFTDVEDKTISEAEKKKKTIQVITQEVADYFYKEAETLMLKIPENVPRATSSISATVHIIQKLIAQGHAYWYKGDVFFDPLTYPEFGKLFRLDMAKWPKHKVRFKKDTYNGNRWNLGDFILWHGEKNMDHTGDDAMWDTKIGRGRPSWNIQDPAMIVNHFGYEVDINCGGIDNIYRHHDYTIAIMESLSKKTYANFYLHGEHLIVNGKSMSKSSGNILYPEDILQNGIKPYHLRFFLAGGNHYRKQLNYTSQSFSEAVEKLDTVRTLIKQISSEQPHSKDDPRISSMIESIPKEFEAAMNDDLNVPKAFDNLLLLLQALQKQTEHNSLTKIQADKFISNLDRIDSVLKVLF